MSGLPAGLIIQTDMQVFLGMFKMRFITKQAASIGIIVITTGVLSAVGHARAQNAPCSTGRNLRSRGSQTAPEGQA